MDRGITRSDWAGALTSPELQLIYETAPIGLAFFSTDCRYLLINQHLTEICGISVAEHIGRSVRETVPDVAAQRGGISSDQRWNNTAALTTLPSS